MSYREVLRAGLALFVGLNLLAVAAVRAEPSQSERRAALDDILSTFLEDGAPGAALYVSAPGFNYCKAGGLAEVPSRRSLKPDDLFRIASVSKTYFGVLAAILHLQGKIDLYRPLGQSFPEIAARFHVRRDPKTGELWDPSTVTLYEMLQHRGGIPDPLDADEFQSYELARLSAGAPLEEEAALRQIYSMGLTSRPGTTAVYSNGGFILAAYLVEQVTHRPYWVDMREQIFTPLGLKSTFNGGAEIYPLERLAHGYDDSVIPAYTDWGRLDQGNGFANGGIVTTLAELARFYRGIFKEPNFPRGVDKQRFLSVLLPNAQTPRAKDGTAYAMGMMKDQDGAYSHAGFFLGYIGTALYWPEHDLTVVIEMTGDSQHLQDVKKAKIAEIKKLWGMLPQRG